MTSTLTNFDISLIVMAVMTALFFIVRFDRYLTRRRSAVINANHLMRILAEPTAFERKLDFSFRRRRALRDSEGKVVAIQFEEITLLDFDHSGIATPRRQIRLLPSAA